MLLSAAFSQETLTEDRGAIGLAQTLRKLENGVRVLHIAAHPDDEDSGTLTWLARGRGAHLVLLALNRGEAGANLVSSDFFDRLGALRTVEFLRAAQYYGAAGLRFTRFIDYGYSKNVAETFRNWNREDVLRDVVRVIRQERPHIVISRFQGTPRDGHGNHEAAGILARQAFDASGDGARFPEPGVEPWQPLKFYTGTRGEDWTLRVDSGQYDPLLGRSYAQMGREGYRRHRSQGASPVIPPAGPSYAYYKLAASKVGMADKEADFFERVPRGRAWLTPAGFNALDPAAAAPQLARALSAARAAQGKDAEVARAQILTALEQALGIDFTALADPDEMPSGPFSAFRAWESFRYATPGQRFTVTTTLHSPHNAVKFEKTELQSDGWAAEPLEPSRFSVTVPPDATPTRAYWWRTSVRDTSYRLDDEKSFGRPLPPSPLRARAVYRIHGVQASVERDVETSHLDQLGLQYRRSLAVAPAVSLRYAAEAGYLPRGKRTYRLEVAVTNHLHGAAEGTLRLEAPPGWRCAPEQAVFKLANEGEEVVRVFEIAPPPGVKEGEYAVRASASVAGRQSADTFLPVTQPELAAVYLSRPARHSIRVVDVNVAPGLRTGYIAGTGDDVPQAMRQLGIAVEMLDASALANADLSQYHTILMGIRAYAARADVRVFHHRLLDYVSNGGVLIVQYNTQEYDHNFGPFPYSMTSRAEEVSEEDAPVTILEPGDPVFLKPNRITAKDFDGWVEQRGSKFFTTWHEGWKPLIETHDTGQAPQKGVWLTARHGKGLYVYCALAWYRQLPYAVPGAARIFANLVSLGALY